MWTRRLLLLLAVALALQISFAKVKAPRFTPVTSRASQRRSSFSYTEHYFQQTLDHFNVGNITLFPQRYLLNNNSWSGAASRGPIFVYCGNEGDIVWFAQNTGFMFDIAPQFEALLVFPEHRFYGLSQPFGNATNGPRELAFLTAEQALADFATLIVDLKKNLSAESSPVVVFGGSYGGMLAYWFRLKYPHIAIGALASSAPVLQFEDIVPSSTFYDIVSSDFKREGGNCFDVIRSSWSVMEEVADQPGGLHKLSETFHLCKDLDSVGDLTNWLSSAYSYLAMVNYPYAADFLMPLPAYPIREFCKATSEAPNGITVLERLYAGVNVYYNFTGSEKCFNIDADPHGMDYWDWQACTEMVMPMTSNISSGMFYSFGWDLEEWETYCWKAYGAIPRPKWMTTEFGGHDVKSYLQQFGSNIILSNGLLDPWSGGSVLKNISSSVVALVTEEGAHHLDLRWATENDPEWLVGQRRSEVNEIKRWVDEYFRASSTLKYVM